MLLVCSSLPRVVLGQLVSHLLLVVQLAAVDLLVLRVQVLAQLSNLFLPLGVEVLDLFLPILLSLCEILRVLLVTASLLVGTLLQGLCVLLLELGGLLAVFSLLC